MEEKEIVNGEVKQEFTKEKKKKRIEIKSPSWFKKVRELWKVPRYKAFMKLGFYVVFFTLIMLSLQINYFIQKARDENRELTIEEKFENLNSLNYKLVEAKNEVASIYSSTWTKDSVTLISILDNKKFHITKDGVFLEQNEELLSTNSLLDINLYKITPKKLMELVNNAEEISTTKYKTGAQEINSELGVQYIKDLFNICDVKNKKIPFIITKTSNRYIKFSFNFSNMNECHMYNEYKIDIEIEQED